MKAKTILIADEGMVLTDGEVYGKTIYLADSANVEDYHEITQAEYEEIEKAMLAEAMPRENEME